MKLHNFVSRNQIPEERETIKYDRIAIDLYTSLSESKNNKDWKHYKVGPLDEDNRSS